MELKLEHGLEHQLTAIDAVADAFKGVNFDAPSKSYENPVFTRSSPLIPKNIEDVQKRTAVPATMRTADVNPDRLHIDVKMETGTGKTYVYSRLMYELHKRHKINKFVIVVPTLAIKAGTSSFLDDKSVQAHFRDACGYGTKISVGVVEPTKKQKKGRQYFPGPVEDFAKGTAQIADRIHVLVINMQLLTNGKLLTRDDYDTDVEGFSKPIEAIAATRPFVIIDEPHRIAPGQTAFKKICEELRPQCIIRFGATFPDAKKGAKDYRNLVYDLNACKSFNAGLIKGVAKEHFESPTKESGYLQITKIAAKESVHFKLVKDGTAEKHYVLKTGDSLGVVDDAFQGITVTAIGKSEVVFSNGVEKGVGYKMMLAAFMGSYQEQMIRLALQRHFETERENFASTAARIKTLALFFIDDIASYRGEGEKAYLRTCFEKALKERIGEVMKELRADEVEYQDYLQKTLDDLAASHAGYFSQDNSDTDEAVAEEVREILHGKKELISFRHSDGSWNTRRFLFSKWTLKEGWDNPNVFTIAKLRSSGSEISKLQEVGRGLRLPVDENGNRISNREFQLNYIVDFTERDFAEKLVAEINGAGERLKTISDELLEKVAKKLGKTAEELLGALLGKGYVNFKKEVMEEKYGAFITDYPDFKEGESLGKGKVKDRNKKASDKVRIRKGSFDKLRELWMKINQRYVLTYEDSINADLPTAILETLEKSVFADTILQSQRTQIQKDNGRVKGVSEQGRQYVVREGMSYGKFLRMLSVGTNIPITALHGGVKAFVAKHGAILAWQFNEGSADRFASAFRDWRNEHLMGRFKYAKTGASIHRTALTDAAERPVDDIAQGRIGLTIEEGEPCEKYLYEKWAYDSPLEKKNVMSEIDEVIVYGKVPRRSIAIPTITGGTFSPDFIYVVKRKDGTKELNLVVETKDVEKKSDLRKEEELKIKCAQIFFKNLSDEGYDVKFRAQLKNDEMKTIVSETASATE